MAAATVELRGPLLHRDYCFECIAAVTGRPLQQLQPRRRQVGPVVPVLVSFTAVRARPDGTN